MHMSFHGVTVELERLYYSNSRSLSLVIRERGGKACHYVTLHLESDAEWVRLATTLPRAESFVDYDADDGKPTPLTAKAPAIEPAQAAE